jgi:ferredoxin
MIQEAIKKSKVALVPCASYDDAEVLAAMKTGLGTYHYENINIVGANAEDYICCDFDVVRKPVVSAAGGRISRFMKNRTSPRPAINKALCNQCGTCVRHCPVNPKAVDWAGDDKTRPPVHNYDRCIRCFCCQELCPQGAIFVQTPWPGRIIYR